MQTNNGDQVIYLKDLLFSALYRWKRILVWGLVLAILLGGLKGISAYRAAKAAQAQLNDPARQVLELESYEAEKDALESQLTTLQENIQRQTAYLEESVLMQLDPYAFYEVSLSVYIDTGYQILPGMDYQSPDLTKAIISSYITVLTGEASAQAVASAMGIDPVYLLELISTSASDGTNTLQIRAKYPDQKGAEKLLTLLVQQLTRIQSDISQTVQAHELRTIQQYVRQMSDTDLADMQTQQEQALMDLYDSIDATEAELEALVPPQTQAAGIGSTVKSAVIFAIIGGVLGVFLAVLTAWIGHIGSSKVYSARTLCNRTNIKVLGCVNTAGGQDPITAKLRALEGRSLSDSAQQTQLIAANIRNLCKDSKHLLVTGSVDAASITDALCQAMPGMQITGCGSLLADIAAVEALAKCDHVLLVEKCGVSRYTDIDQTLSMIVDNGKKLLGCVLLDG